jgi:hypothetical protein
MTVPSVTPNRNIYNYLILIDIIRQHSSISHNRLATGGSKKITPQPNTSQPIEIAQMPHANVGG